MCWSIKDQGLVSLNLQQTSIQRADAAKLEASVLKIHLNGLWRRRGKEAVYAVSFGHLDVNIISESVCTLLIHNVMPQYESHGYTKQFWL